MKNQLIIQFERIVVVLIILISLSTFSCRNANNPENEWLIAKSLNDINVYEYFIYRNPDCIYIDSAKYCISKLFETVYFREMQKRNTIYSYSKYLEKFPVGIYSEPAKMNIDRIKNGAIINLNNINKVFIKYTENYGINDFNILDHTFWNNFVFYNDLILTDNIDSADIIIEIEAYGKALGKNYVPEFYDYYSNSSNSFWKYSGCKHETKIKIKCGLKSYTYEDKCIINPPTEIHTEWNPKSDIYKTDAPWDNATCYVQNLYDKAIINTFGVNFKYNMFLFDVTSGTMKIVNDSFMECYINKINLDEFRPLISSGQIGINNIKLFYFCKELIETDSLHLDEFTREYLKNCNFYYEFNYNMSFRHLANLNLLKNVTKDLKPRKEKGRYYDEQGKLKIIDTLNQENLYYYLNINYNLPKVFEDYLTFYGYGAPENEESSEIEFIQGFYNYYDESIKYANFSTKKTLFYKSLDELRQADSLLLIKILINNFIREPKAAFELNKYFNAIKPIEIIFTSHEQDKFLITSEYPNKHEFFNDNYYLGRSNPVEYFEFEYDLYRRKIFDYYAELYEKYYK